jgi:hypothetical protein
MLRMAQAEAGMHSSAFALPSLTVMLALPPSIFVQVSSNQLNPWKMFAGRSGETELSTSPPESCLAAIPDVQPASGSKDNAPTSTIAANLAGVQSTTDPPPMSFNSIVAMDQTIGIPEHEVHDRRLFFDDEVADRSKPDLSTASGKVRVDWHESPCTTRRQSLTVVASGSMTLARQ